MNNPDFVIKLSQRTQGGALRTSDIQAIRAKLLWRGLILLPSDTCYSLASLAISKNERDKINLVLNRENLPISLAFPNFLKVDEWVNLNPITAILLETFTPGPLTIVCPANTKLPIDFTNHAVGSADRTIGVRIPDSSTEREVASCTNYLITTVAVRNPKNGKVVQDFEQALEIVGRRMTKINSSWGAIEGGDFYTNHSTVVQVTDGPEKLKLIREGDIAFSEIQAVSGNIPAWSYEDWT